MKMKPDYWIAGAILLAAAIFGGRDLAKSLWRKPVDAGAVTGHIDAGLRFYNVSRFGEAEAEFRKAIAADGASALAYNDLGAALNSERRWDDAIAALRKALELNATLDLAKNNLDWAYARKAHGGGVAIGEGERAANARIGAGMAFYNAREFGRSEAEFREAVRLDGASALAYNDLGAALNAEKRWEEAIPVLRKALELNPAMELAKNNLALAIGQRDSHAPDSRR